MAGEGSRVTATRELLSEAQPRRSVIGAVDHHQHLDRPLSIGFPLPGGVFSVSDIPVHPLGAAVVQAKLTIGEAGDPLEREADEVAAAVLGSDEECSSISCASANWRLLQRAPASPYDDDIQVEPASEEEDEEAAMVQAKAIGPSITAHNDFTTGLNTLRGSGRELPRSLRSQLEPHFGYDFGKVRVHADGEAAHLAASINARAFTSGRDIVFGGEQFSPGTVEGRRLLAHELTHVVQQGHAGQLADGKGGSLSQGFFGVAVDSDPERIRCVRWSPGQRTGRYQPWPDDRPAIWGTLYEAQTDGSSTIHIWQPENHETYWCHGYTFGGAPNSVYGRGGPYSVRGFQVVDILKDDGWKFTGSNNVRGGDILVFTGTYPITHSGIITRVVRNNGRIDESQSSLSSKWGYGRQCNVSWQNNADYGQYWCYSKQTYPGPNIATGTNESRTKPPTGETPAVEPSAADTHNTGTEVVPESGMNTDSGGGNAD